MTPLKAFLIRAALSFVIAFMLYQLYFGKIVWVDVGVFAAILLAWPMVPKHFVGEEKNSPGIPQGVRR